MVAKPGPRRDEGRSEFRHCRLRPRQNLGRLAAADNDEVVGIRDDTRTESFAAFGQPPVFQEPVHIDVGQQWTRDAALRRAARTALAATHAPGPVPIPFLDRRLQPQLDQPQHGTIRDAASHRFKKVVVRNRIEVFGKVGVDHIGVAPADEPVHFLDRVHRPASGAIAVGIVLEAQIRFVSVRALLMLSGANSCQRKKRKSGQFWRLFST